jgi:molecular chaperone DnaK
MKFQEGRTVGIDLGTTFSTLAYLNEEGVPVPITNEDGDQELPSLILLANSGHVVVGPNRMRAAMEDPNNVVERIKRHMGETEDEYKKTFDGKEITPEFLSALILKKLKQDAEKQLGKIGNAVITVPYYFNDLRRKATQDAGRIAGIHVIDIINEPTAATLTYAWKDNALGETSDTDKQRYVLVYDLGGGTFDVTVVSCTQNHFRVLATDGDVMLGGVDWNDRLLDYVADQFQQEHGIDFRATPAAAQMIRYECDQAKILLSQSEEAVISCRCEGKSFSVPVTRSQFEELTADLAQRTMDTTEGVIQQAKISVEQLDCLVMVGGSSLMPMVRERLVDEIGVSPFEDISPFTAVAQGAAIHAAILEAKHRKEQDGMADGLRKMLRSVKQTNVNSHGLGIVARNPKDDKPCNYVMIPRNTKLPVEKRQTFVTNKPGQKRVHVKVLQGEAPDPSACVQIGDCRITGLPENLPQGSPVEVIYRFDESGRISVRAEEKTGSVSATTEIERQGALDDAKIDVLADLANTYRVE